MRVEGRPETVARDGGQMGRPGGRGEGSETRVWSEARGGKSKGVRVGEQEASRRRESERACSRPVRGQLQCAPYAPEITRSRIAGLDCRAGWEVRGGSDCARPREHPSAPERCTTTQLGWSLYRGATIPAPTRRVLPPRQDASRHLYTVAQRTPPPTPPLMRHPAPSPTRHRHHGRLAAAGAPRARTAGLTGAPRPTSLSCPAGRQSSNSSPTVCQGGEVGRVQAWGRWGGGRGGGRRHRWHRWHRSGP